MFMGTWRLPLVVLIWSYHVVQVQGPVIYFGASVLFVENIDPDTESDDNFFCQQDAQGAALVSGEEKADRLMNNNACVEWQLIKNGIWLFFTIILVVWHVKFTDDPSFCSSTNSCGVKTWLCCICCCTWSCCCKLDKNPHLPAQITDNSGPVGPPAQIGNSNVYM